MATLVTNVSKSRRAEIWMNRERHFEGITRRTSFQYSGENRQLKYVAARRRVSTKLGHLRHLSQTTYGKRCTPAAKPTHLDKAKGGLYRPPLCLSDFPFRQRSDAAIRTRPSHQPSPVRSVRSS